MAPTSTVIIKELAGHAAPQLDPVQTFIMERIGFFTNMWIAIWWITLAVLIFKLWYDYRQHTHGARR
jgi:hypothetical protein